MRNNVLSAKKLSTDTQLAYKASLNKEMMCYFSQTIDSQSLNLKLLYVTSEILTSISFRGPDNKSIVCHIDAVDLLSILDNSDDQKSAIDYTVFLTKLAEMPLLRPYFEKDRLGAIGFIWFVIRQIDKIAVVLDKNSFEHDFKIIWSFVQNYYSKTSDVVFTFDGMTIRQDDGLKNFERVTPRGKKVFLVDLFTRQILTFSTVVDVAAHCGVTREYLAARLSKEFPFSQGRYFITREAAKADHMLATNRYPAKTRTRTIESIRVFDESSETVGVFSGTSALGVAFGVATNTVSTVIAQTPLEKVHCIKFPKRPGLYMDVTFSEQ